MEQCAASPEQGLTCLFLAYTHPPKYFEKAILVSYASEEVAGQEGCNLLCVSVKIVFERKVIVACEEQRLYGGCA